VSNEPVKHLEDYGGLANDYLSHAWEHRCGFVNEGLYDKDDPICGGCRSKVKDYRTEVVEYEMRPIKKHPLGDQALKWFNRHALPVGPAEAEFHHTFADTRWAEEQQAYDGSTTPQRGMLTPRERDLVTRIFADIIHQVTSSGGNPSLMFKPTPQQVEKGHVAGGIGMDQACWDAMLRARDVLNPRQD